MIDLMYFDWIKTLVRNLLLVLFTIDLTAPMLVTSNTKKIMALTNYNLT